MTAHTYRSSKPTEDSALPSAALAPSGLSPEAGSQAEQPAANAGSLLREHFKRMMEAAANYVEPTTYIARHPNTDTVGDCQWVREYPETNESQSSVGWAATKLRRDQAFINDMIYMLDGPEQRAAIANATGAA